MREEVRRAIAAGVPAWAECGGLMYLSRGIAWGGRRAAMAGALPCSVEMDDRPAGHGYVLLEETGRGAWPHAGRRLRGHEFHHSRLVGLEPGADFAYRVLRGAGAVARLRRARRRRLRRRLHPPARGRRPALGGGLRRARPGAGLST